jgi:hypothetical protein
MQINKYADLAVAFFKVASNLHLSGECGLQIICNTEIPEEFFFENASHKKIKLNDGEEMETNYWKESFLFN